MTWTRHGHHIPASPTDDEQGDRPPVARCGGTHLCKKCKEDFALYLEGKKTTNVDEIKFDKPTTFRPVDGDVTAVQVTEENAQVVADWAGGEVRSSGYSQQLAVVIPTLVAPEVVTVGNYVVKKGNRFSGAQASDFEKAHIHRPDLETVGESSDSMPAAASGTYLDIEDHIRRRAMSEDQYERSADQTSTELPNGPNGSWPAGYKPNRPRLGR
jgi:hypothetical protein